MFEFIFPEDEQRKPNLKILASAQAWMKKKAELETLENEKNEKEKENQREPSPKPGSSHSMD